MDFDEVLSLVGDLGRYQAFLFAAVCIPACLAAAATIFSHIFISEVPEHHCRFSVTSEQASHLNSSLAPAEDLQNALNMLFLPLDAKGSFSQCQQYDINPNTVIKQVVKQYNYLNSTILSEYVAQNNWPSVQCLDGWEYDTSEYSETLATKFNAVCDQAWLRSTAQSAFFLGGIIGSVAFGMISDKWGRRPALFGATALMVLGNFMEAFPPSYQAYIAMRFAVGLCYPSVYNLAFLVVAEMIGTKKRMLSSVVCHISYSFGMMVIAYVAHFIRDWQNLQMAFSLPMVLLISYYWMVPESPRWLISQGRLEEAEAIVQKMARINKVPLSANFLQSNLEGQSHGASPSGQKSDKIGVTQLLQYPKVVTKIFIIAIVWSLSGMVYHGMSFATPDLPSDTYFAFFMVGLFEIPGTLSAWYTMERFGRRNTIFVTLLLSGVFSIATAFVPDDAAWLSILLASLSKFCTSSTFTVIYVYAGELFPTVIRGFAIGMASTTGQTCLVITPYILYLGTVLGGAVPFLIIGTLGGLAALLVLSLPETLDSPLPSTLDESENYAEYLNRRRESRQLKAIVEVKEAREPTRTPRSYTINT
ncbi:organic cation transporter protein [Galendromus occidentalis]|uniref:Organic cation transporter protein n=1 Tax=Galendromus occidentalis TaxID=34638 RepID=A0AAJ7L6V1_9ACAR|nr:organic cation transporter protein [Galendromus occidentalis]